MNPTTTSDGALLDLPALAERFAAAARRALSARRAERRVRSAAPRRVRRRCDQRRVRLGEGREKGAARDRPRHRRARARRRRACARPSPMRRPRPGSSTCGWSRCSGSARSRRCCAKARHTAAARTRRAHLARVRQRESRPDRWSSCKAARSRSATRSRRRCASPATTCSPNGSSTTRARRWTRSRVRSTRATCSCGTPSFPFPEDGYPGRLPGAHRRAHSRRSTASTGATPLKRNGNRTFAAFGRDHNVREQQAVAARFGATFDLWQSEKALHDGGAIAAGIERLRALG